jgi:hypothetical protein
MNFIRGLIKRFRNTASTQEFIPQNDNMKRDLNLFLDEWRPHIIEYIATEINAQNVYKLSLIVKVYYDNPHGGHIVPDFYPAAHLSSGNMDIYPLSDIEPIITRLFDVIKGKNLNYTKAPTNNAL